MDHDELITQFCSVTGAAPSTAQAVLTNTNWNLEEAVALFYAGQDPQDNTDEMDEEEDVPQPSGPSSAAQPARPSSSSSSRPSRPPPNQSKSRTSADLQGSGSGAGAGDDDSDDEKQDFFAGGEKSGLAVQNPNQGGGAPDHFRNIIEHARQQRERPGGDEEPVRSSNFSGRAQTLGGDDAPSQVIDDPDAATQTRSLPRVTRTLHLWQDGFSVDDGPLYRFDDPANAPTLALINSGRAPSASLGVQPGQEVDSNLNPHKDEKYVAPKRKFKPFGGQGQRSGSPTPGVASGSSTPPSAAIPAASTASAAAAGEAPKVSVDESQPVITLQIRSGDGTRLQSRFNTTHTIGDVYEFVTASNAQSRQRGFASATTFPTKESTDKTAVLGDMAEFKRGGVVVQKWT